MKNKLDITIDDAIFYMEMIRSVWSPYYEPQYGKRKPYLKILKDRESIEYNRFIKVYRVIKHILSDREQFILDQVYALNNSRAPHREIGEQLDVSPERIRQIIKKAENTLARELLKNTVSEYRK